MVIYIRNLSYQTIIICKYLIFCHNFDYYIIILYWVIVILISLDTCSTNIWNVARRLISAILPIYRENKTHKNTKLIESVSFILLFFSPHHYLLAHFHVQETCQSEIHRRHDNEILITNLSTAIHELI